MNKNGKLSIKGHKKWLYKEKKSKSDFFVAQRI